MGAVEKFREAGGKAILFPGFTNVLHKELDDPVMFILHKLEQELSHGANLS